MPHRLINLACIILSSIFIRAAASVGGDDRNRRQLGRTSVRSTNSGSGGRAGQVRSRDNSGVTRRYLPDPPPVADAFRCNVCKVPDTIVSKYSTAIEFDGAEMACHELQTMGLNGDIAEEKCEAAQTIALGSCGCIVENGFTTGHINSTCPAIDGCLTQDEQEWLDTHNSRREFWQTYYETDFVELCWDKALAEQAQYFADYLAENCLVQHDYSRLSPTSFCRGAGENLAFDTAQNGVGRSAKDVTFAWTDREFNVPPPHDGHLTQVVWRPTKYLGCARASNANCRWKNIQVCRYVRHGNCNCAHTGNCRAKMLEDSSFCGTEEVEVSLEEYIDCFEDYHSTNGNGRDLAVDPRVLGVWAEEPQSS